MSMRNGNAPDPNQRNGADGAGAGDDGIDGLLCPVCGRYFGELPVGVRRMVGEHEERMHVCSTECRKLAMASPFLQTDLFGEDVRVWTRSTQGELPLSSRDSSAEE